MKRDLKLNISELRTVYQSIRSAWEALGEITYASGRFREVLKDQDSLAYERLTRIWEERIEAEEKELSERLETLSDMVLSYINEMTALVEPEDESLRMRVDRNDICHNCVQIEMEAVESFRQDRSFGLLWDSACDYKRLYISNPFLSAAENAAKKAAQEEAEKEEKARRERNYAKLEAFKNHFYSESLESLKGWMGMIDEIYGDHIVPFENTDDAYKKKLSACYDDWATFGERMGDIGNGLWDVGRGALDAVADLVKGIGGLLKGTGEIILWAGASVLEPFGVELSDEIEDDVEQIFATGKMVLSDPVNAIGAIGQNICDVVDEEGIAYSVSYVADVRIEIALEKGIGKIKEFKNAKHVSKVDAAGDLTGVERRVINKVDEVADEVLESGSTVRGTLTGKLDGLTAAEKTMVNDLLNAGNDVEIIPRSNIPGQKTPDFLVNGVKTELKTLTGTSLNTPVTRIQDGFKQGAEVVIIDGRNTGLTIDNANTVIERILGKYGGELPGTVEIWTIEGIIRR